MVTGCISLLDVVALVEPLHLSGFVIRSAGQQLRQLGENHRY